MQARVAQSGMHNVPASRIYAQTAQAIFNAVTVGKGKAPAQALEGLSRSFSCQTTQ